MFSEGPKPTQVSPAPFSLAQSSSEHRKVPPGFSTMLWNAWFPPLTQGGAVGKGGPGRVTVGEHSAPAPTRRDTWQSRCHSLILLPTGQSQHLHLPALRAALPPYFHYKLIPIFSEGLEVPQPQTLQVTEKNWNSDSSCLSRAPGSRAARAGSHTFLSTVVFYSRQ